MKVSPRPRTCPYIHASWTFCQPFSSAVGLRSNQPWTYDYPLREVARIAGMIAFYNEELDIFVDDTRSADPSPTSPSAGGERV
jgi:uncharacterized protein (DUF427 family)